MKWNAALRESVHKKKKVSYFRLGVCSSFSSTPAFLSTSHGICSLNSLHSESSTRHTPRRHGKISLHFLSTYIRNDNRQPTTHHSIAAPKQASKQTSNMLQIENNMAMIS